MPKNKGALAGSTDRRGGAGPRATELFPSTFPTHRNPAHAGKGGKNRRRGKNENEETKRDLIFKEDGQGACDDGLRVYHCDKDVSGLPLRVCPSLRLQQQPHPASDTPPNPTQPKSTAQPNPTQPNPIQSNPTQSRVVYRLNVSLR